MILALCSGLMNVGSHVSGDRHRFWPTKEPVTKWQSVTSQIHQRPTTGTVHIPEPVCVGAGVHFRLFHQIDPTERSLICHLFGFDIFGGEKQFFRVEEEDTVTLGSGNHLIALSECHRHWLFYYNMLSCLCHRNRNVAVKLVGRGASHHLDLWIFEHLMLVSEHLGNPVLVCESRGIARRR